MQRFLSRFAFTSLSVLVAFGAVGCSDAAEEETADDAAEYRSRPKGQDANLAKLVIRAPAGAKKGTVSLSRPAEKTAMTGDVIDKLVPVPDAVWEVNSEATSMRAWVSGNATLESKKTTELKLAGLKAKWKGGPRTLGLDGTNPIYARTLESLLGVSSRNDMGFEIREGATGTTTIPMGPGKYLVSWGFYDGVVLEASPGEVASIDVASKAGRRLARIIAPATRELPNGCNSTSFDSGVMLMVGTSTWREELTSGPLIVGHNPAVAELSGADAESTPMIALPCVNPTALPFGAIGAGAKDYVLGRLDVDDVEIAVPGGGTDLRPGTYVVYDATTDAEVTTTSLPTNTGIDLPPGKYRLVVDYQDNVGQMRSYEETFTTP